MKTRVALALLFALLVALCAWGQTFQRSLPFLARNQETATTPNYLDNLELHWVASDYNSFGIAASSNWLDRVQAKELAFFAGNTITNTTNDGMTFWTENCNNQITNNTADAYISPWMNSGYFTNSALSFIARYKWVLANGGGTPKGYGFFWINDNTDTYNEMSFWNTGPPYTIQAYGAGGLTHGTIDANTWYALTFYTTNDAAAARRVHVYANGTLVGYVTNWFTGMSAFGYRTNLANWAPFLGDLQEIIFQTNVVGLNPNNLASNVYKYYTTQGGATYVNRTNFAGVRLVAQYVGSDYTTNAGIPTWPDRSANHYDLTNQVAANSPSAVLNGVNTNTVVRFNGITNYIKCDPFANTSIAEYFVVVNLSSHGTADYDIILDGTNYLGNCHQLYRDKVADTFIMAAGSALTASKAVTNNWFIANAVFSGGRFSKLTTNNVDSVTGNTGAYSLKGLLLGAQQASTGPFLTRTKMDVAEILAYQDNLPNNIRSNIWLELKSVYGL